MRGKEWTSEEDDFMRAHYPRESSDEVARKLRRSVVAVYGRAGILGLKKTEEYHDVTRKRLAGQKTSLLERSYPGQQGAENAGSCLRESESDHV